MSANEGKGESSVVVIIMSSSHKGGVNGHEQGQGDAGRTDEACLRPKQAPSRVCEAELLCITWEIIFFIYFLEFPGTL